MVLFQKLLKRIICKMYLGTVAINLRKKRLLIFFYIHICIDTLLFCLKVPVT